MSSGLAGDRLRASMAVALGASSDLLEQVGTSVVPTTSRAGTNQVACYQLGLHTVLSCDPSVMASLSPLFDRDSALTDDAFRSWGHRVGGTIVGQAVMKSWETSLHLPSTGHGAHVFDWTLEPDRRRVAAFVDACDDHDLDEAELDLDDLDDLAVGILDAGGDICAYASSRPFDEDETFGDIAVIVRPADRAVGLGRAVVSDLITTLLLPRHVEPLYRCDPNNTGSDRLSAGLGFVPALSLTLVELESV